MRKTLLLSLIPLCGCSASGGVGLANSALTGALAGIAPTITVDQILQQYAIYHNLKIGLEQIEASGMITMTTQSPVIISGTPMSMPVPVTPPVVSPALPTGPTNNG